MKRIRRTMLFMPGDDRRKIEKGTTLGSDSIIMDLEDGVAHPHKEAGRTTIAAALRELNFGHSERLVRINPIGSGLEDDDLAATIGGKPDGYVIPKVENAQHIEKVNKWLTVEENERGWEVGSIRLFALIETARGVVNLHQICEDQVRLEALMFGAEDLAGDLGAVRTPTMHEVAYARSAVVVYATAYNLQAIDTPYVDIHNLDGLQAETRTALHMGYDGKLCIHPKHLPVIHQVYTPTQEETARARALIQAYEAHQGGVFVYEGKMVDMPMIRAAQTVLARAEAAR